MTTAALAGAFVDSLDFSGLPHKVPQGGTGLSAGGLGRANTGVDFGELLLRSPFTSAIRADIDLTEPIPSPAIADPTDAITKAVTEGVDQSFLVGSQIVSFDTAITEERRSAALASCLLAQLRASKLHPSPTTAPEAFEWHAAYINTLTNIGWVLQSGVVTQQSTATKGAAVSKAMIEIIGTLLGGGAAVALITKVLDSLSKLNASDPFISLYSSRVIEQNIIDFGASIGTSSASGFLISVVECAMELKVQHTDVLLFKWDATDANVDARRYDLSLADDVYQAVAKQILEKVKPFVAGNVSTMEI